MIMKLVEFTSQGEHQEISPEEFGDRLSQLQKPLADEPSKKAQIHLNLSEFPMFALSTRTQKSKVLTVTGTRSVDSKTKTTQLYEWIVQPHSQYGLPGPLGQRVFFQALQMWYAQGKPEWGRIVYGTKWSFLRKLGYEKPSKDNYKALVQALYSLTTTVIIARNCFYDRSTGQYIKEVVFHPFDSFTHDPDDEYGKCYIRLPQELAQNVGTNELIDLHCKVGEFHGMTPLQRRFLPYLSKFMRLQTWHTKTLDEIRDLGPIEVKSDRKLRQTLKGTFDPLLSVIPEFRNWKFDTRKNGTPCVTFYSTKKKSDRVSKPRKIVLHDLTDSREQYELEKVEQVVGDSHRFLWLIGIKELGIDRFTRCRGDLVDAQLDGRKVQNPGKVFWAALCKTAQEERGIDLKNAMKTKYVYKPRKKGSG